MRRIWKRKYRPYTVDVSQHEYQHIKPPNWPDDWFPWIPDPRDNLHLDGVPWQDSPVPPENHVCWAQSKGKTTTEEMRRCPCGGFQSEDMGEYWLLKNSRKEEE